MTWPEPPNYFNPPQHGYKVVLQQPQHPVVHADPSFMQVGECMLPSRHPQQGMSFRDLSHSASNDASCVLRAQSSLRSSSDSSWCLSLCHFTASNMRPGSWALVGGMMLFGAAAGYYTGTLVKVLRSRTTHDATLVCACNRRR
eukprot:1161355-Pelagomonas_calceolata.AAC.8